MAVLQCTHIKSRVEVAPEVELFPYILDHTRESKWLLLKVLTYIPDWSMGEQSAEITPTSATSTLLLICVYLLVQSTINCLLFKFHLPAGLVLDPDSCKLHFVQTFPLWKYSLYYIDWSVEWVHWTRAGQSWQTMSKHGKWQLSHKAIELNSPQLEGLSFSFSVLCIYQICAAI